MTELSRSGPFEHQGVGADKDVAAQADFGGADFAEILLVAPACRSNLVISVSTMMTLAPNSVSAPMLTFRAAQMAAPLRPTSSPMMICPGGQGPQDDGMIHPKAVSLLQEQRVTLQPSSMVNLLPSTRWAGHRGSGSFHNGRVQPHFTFPSAWPEERLIYEGFFPVKMPYQFFWWRLGRLSIKQTYSTKSSYLFQIVMQTWAKITFFSIFIFEYLYFSGILLNYRFLLPENIFYTFQNNLTRCS